MIKRVYFEKNNIESLKGLGNILNGNGVVPNNIYYKNNPISGMLDSIVDLPEKINTVIEIFNEYNITCYSDKDYIKQLFEDHGVKVKWNFDFL